MKKDRDHKVLLTGAGGYIGAVAVEALIKNGFLVRALDSYYWGDKVLDKYKHRIEIVRADIRRINSSILNGIESVIHAAGLSNDPMAEFNPKANFEINTTATLNFAKICKAKGVKKFIFASSASIYDRPNGGKLLQSENSIVIPKAAYSVSKYKAELGLKKLASKNFSIIIFRQGTVYGYSPRLRYDLVVNTMVKDALQKKVINVYCHGEQWRPIVDVNDVASAYIMALASKNDASGHIFNLAYKNYKILDLAKVVKKSLESKSELKIKLNIQDSKKIGRNYKITTNKIKEFFNWHPTISVESSVENLVAKIKKNSHEDYDHPKYYNIEWMKLLVETQSTLKHHKKIF